MHTLFCDLVEDRAGRLWYVSTVRAENGAFETRAYIDGFRFAGEQAVNRTFCADLAEDQHENMVARYGWAI